MTFDEEAWNHSVELTKLMTSHSSIDALELAFARGLTILIFTAIALTVVLVLLGGI